MVNKLMASADVFKGLDNSELELFEKKAKEVILPIDQIIFKEKEKGDKMYLILEGAVDIWKSEGKELKGSRLARLKPGEIFGEMALFDHEPRSASAVAAIAKESKILEWSEKDIAKIVQEKPELGIKMLNNILKKISQRLRVANEAIHTLLRANQYIGL